MSLSRPSFLESKLKQKEVSSSHRVQMVEIRTSGINIGDA